MFSKTQALPSLSKHVRIIKHRQKVGGGCGVLHDVFWREEEPWVVLALLSGLRTAVPASWTDLPLEDFSSPANVEGSAPRLAELAKPCRGLLERADRRSVETAPQLCKRQKI